MTIMHVVTNYAKNYAIVIYQSLIDWISLRFSIS